MAMTERHPVEYAQQVERVQLVSAFLPSLLLGEYAPHDESDPGGMNMLDVRSGSWHEGCLAAVEADAERLRARLGERVVPSYTILGRIGAYW